MIAKIRLFHTSSFAIGERFYAIWMGVVSIPVVAPIVLIAHPATAVGSSPPASSRPSTSPLPGT